ncbi:MAG: HEAT repeat domain-containing protein, partial [Nitrospinae bacterium]|nr:HEAT repeat domain-containing protein [Nitrospinota bacterium]
DRDEWVRNMAVEVLAKIGGEETIEPLTWALREDPDPFVRYKALVSLAEIGGDRMMGPLLQSLNDPDELIWAKAEEILQIQGGGGREQ